MSLLDVSIQEVQSELVSLLEETGLPVGLGEAPELTEPTKPYITLFITPGDLEPGFYDWSNLCIDFQVKGVGRSDTAANLAAQKARKALLGQVINITTGDAQKIQQEGRGFSYPSRDDDTNPTLFLTVFYFRLRIT